MSRTFTRTPQACAICRRRKTKCDGIRPRCGHCRVKNLSCTWDVPDVAQIGNSTASPSIFARPVETAGPESFTTAAPDVELLSNPKGLKLCLNAFFGRHFLIDFCSFDHRPDFEKKCELEPVLALSVTALCGRYLDQEDARTYYNTSPSEVSRASMKKARFLAKLSSDEPTVSHVQAHLILAMAELLSNSGSRHWLFAGMAIRLAEIMRLNKDFHQNHTLRDQEIRRRTFWACMLVDSSLAYLLGKHRTISVENVAIPLPGTDSALVYQEPSRGVTLQTLAAYQRPSDLGLTPYLVKTICVWSDMADFALHSRRHTDLYPPTDPNSIFFTRTASLQAWIDALPPSFVWKERNYKDQRVLGQGNIFITMHFLLLSAKCVAHQCYLPHLTLYTKLVDLVDGAGLSYLHREPVLIDSCISHALKVGELLQYLTEFHPKQGEPALLQSVWVSTSILIVANIFLWLQFSPDEACNEEIRNKAKHYSSLAHELVYSWTTEWKAARQWLYALDAMQGLYEAAYEGEIRGNILGWGVDTNRVGEYSDDDDSANDFRPQPGDGYPALISLPLLHSSLKFATSDTSIKSISLQSIWLQLSGGWLYGNFESGGLTESDV